jgi:HEAT repeat protein
MVAQQDGAPRLTIDYTGTNARLAYTAWKRWPLEDIARHELAPVKLPKESKKPRRKAPERIDVEDVAHKLREKLTTFASSTFDVAVRLARRLPPRRATDVLREILASEDNHERRRVLDVAATVRLEEFASDAMAALEDDEGQVRMAAAGFLRRVRHAPALSVIAARMVASRADLLMGSSTMRGWGDKVGVPAIRPLLGSEDPNVRAGACLTLMQYGGKALVGELVELAGHDEPLVAGAALHSLKTLDSAGLERALEAARRRDDFPMVNEACNKFASYKRI